MLINTPRNNWFGKIRATQDLNLQPQDPKSCALANCASSPILDSINWITQFQIILFFFHSVAHSKQ